MNKIYSYGNNGNLNNIYGIYDIYNDSSGYQFFDKINYLLDKVDEISNRDLTKKYEETQIENENELNDTIKRTWSNIKKLDNAEEFCIAAVDLSNIRNKLIHPDKEENIWMTDMTATVLDKAKIVVRECVL